MQHVKELYTFNFHLSQHSVKSVFFLRTFFLFLQIVFSSSRSNHRARISGKRLSLVQKEAQCFCKHNTLHLLTYISVIQVFQRSVINCTLYINIYIVSCLHDLHLELRLHEAVGSKVNRAQQGLCRYHRIRAALQAPSVTELREASS